MTNNIYSYRLFVLPSDYIGLGGYGRSALGDRAFAVAGPRVWNSSSLSARHLSSSRNISRVICSVSLVIARINCVKRP